MPPQNDNWNGTGSWTANLSDWSLGAAPSSTNPTEIQTGTDTLTAAGTTAALQIDAGAQLQLNTGGVLTTSGTATVAGNFYLQNGALVTTTGGLTITGGGRVLLDPGVYIGGNGGSTLAIGGTLTNNSTDGNALYIGSSGISAADTVTAKALSNTGVINIVGNTSVLSTLDITTGAAGFGTAGVETGSVYLQGDSLLEFASGQITTVNGQLYLNGPSAFVADAGSLTKNSALAGLATVAGNFYLQNGAVVSTTGGLSITGGGRVLLDPGVYIGGSGGSTLTINGTLTNNSTDGNALDIGNSGIGAADTVTAKALSNTGVINIVGNTSVLSTLDITTGAAGFGTAAVETGSVYLQGDALLEFASGQITTVNGQLYLNGPSAFVADVGSLTKNSALAGLATVAGNFYLQNGAVVSTTGGLTITGGGRVLVDPGVYIGGNGGSTLTINGTLTNNSTDGNALDIGNSGISAADTVTAKVLSNTGAINIVGAGSVQSTLDITTGAAGFGTVAVETGGVYLQGDALLEFASGQITTIDGQLQLNGPSAFVADAGSLTKNSALAGLATVAGNFYLQNGAVVSTTGGLSITGGGRVLLDPGVYIGGSGGSTLTINGTLTNNSTDGNALYIGSSGIGTADTVTAKALSNTGVIVIQGSGSAQATLDITTGAAGFGTAAVQTGAVYLAGDALLEFASGSGALVADAGSLTNNSALTGLATVAGDFYLQNGAVVSTTGGLSITGGGRVLLDAGAYIGGGGGSTLTINGTLTNSSTDGNALYIGNGNIGAADTVTAKALSNTGVISIQGSGSVQAALDITTGAAGFGTAAVQTGAVYLAGDALLEFASGQITTVDGLLQLSGSGALVADAGSLTNNSALTGLATVAGDFYLQNGAVVSTTGGLSITGGGRVLLDAGAYIGGSGGSTLTINGTLTNSSTDGNALYIGNGSIGAADTVTAKSLSNTGVIVIQGSGSVQATLDITTGAAGFGTAAVQTGGVYLLGDALLEFASGQITTVDGLLQLSGSGAFVADAGSLTTSSALTGLATVVGDFYLQNGAVVSTTGGLSITGGGRVLLDSNPFIGGGGGSTLTINGTLTNTSTDNNALYIGNGSISAADTVTAAGLNNGGAITVQGNGTTLGALDVNGPATNTGSVNIDASGEVVMGAGDAYTQAGGNTTINSGGTLVGGTIDVTGGYLDGTGNVVGTVYDTGGTVVGGSSYGNNLGTLTIDGTYNQSGTGVLGANIANGGGSAGVVAVATGYYVNLSGGTLLVSSTPQVGVVMTVMTFQAGTLIGQFAHVQDGSAIGDGSNVNLGDGTTLEVFYNNDYGTIQIERVLNTTLATTYEWTDGTANWSTASDWSGGVVPDPTADVIIGSTTTGNVTLNNASGDTTVDSLSILASNALTISGVTLTAATGATGVSVASGGTLTLVASGEIDGSVLSGAGTLQTANGNTGVLAGDTIAASTTFVSQFNSTTVLLGTIDNIGTIEAIGGNGSNNILTIGNAVTLTGGGVVTLDTGSGGGNVYVQGNGQTLTNTNNTIQGTGIIGNGSLALVNQSVLDATPEGGTSTLLLNNTGGITNTGTLEATAGGVLQITTTVDNAGGTITADVTSTVEVYNGTIQGGTLVNSAGGTLETITSATLDGTTQGALTISTASVYTATNGSNTYLYGSIVNKGTIDQIGGNGNNGLLNIANAVTLSGGGVVTLSTGSGGGNVYIQGNSQTLTNTNNTIQGTGIIGNGSLALINQSVFDATPEGGTSTLLLNNTGGITNTGTLEATAGGVLQITTTVDNAGGTITADGTSTVEVYNGTIQGGTLVNSAGGTLETITSAALDGTTQGALTISTGSVYTATNGSNTYLYGSIVNKGTIDQIGGNGNNGLLNIANAVTLSGGGVVTLSTQSGGGNAYIQGNSQTLTNTNNTIQGTGIIGNGNLALINNYVIDATPESNTATLTLNNGGIINTGTLEATAGGVLQIETNVTNTGGAITASGTASGGGSSIVDIVNGATITGGTLNTVNTGVVETASGNTAALQGVTIASGSSYTVGNAAQLTLLGTIDNAGSINLAGGNGNNGYLLLGNNVTLTGGGTVTLSTQSGGGNAYIQGDNLTLTNTNNTIQGTGVIGNGNLVLINNSVIDATPESNTSALTLNNGSVTNTATLEAKAGGVLVINTTIDNAGGTILVADATSTVEVVNASIQGGTLVNTAGGTLEAIGNSTLDGTTQGPLTITTGSVYTSTNGGSTTLDGSIVNKGTIVQFGGNGNNGFLYLGNNVTLTGGGTVTLSTQSGGGSAFIQGNNLTLTNTNNTIQGTGIIGNGNLVLINGGTVDATPENNTSTLTLNNSGGVTNNGVLEATGGGTLSLTNQTITNNGTVEAQNASAVAYSPSATNANNSSGVLTGGTWAAYASGGGATVSITGGAVTTDAATIILSGAGSVFQAGDGNTFTTLENSLTTISAGGTLEILGSRVYTTTLAISDSGTVQLGGGTFSAPSLTVASGGQLTGYGTAATPVANSGSIVANGGTLDVTGAESGTGALEALAASVLQLAANSAITTDSVLILLTGAGSEIETGSGTPTKIESSLTTIASGGTLAVLGNRGYSSSLAMTDSGLLRLGGGTFASASLSVTSGGMVLGYGTVTPAVANAGTIEANGGLLDLAAGASGAGTLIADVGATLEFAGTATTTTAGAVIANGTVDLAGGTLTASSITVASGGELLGYGTVTSAVSNSGTVVVNGGQLSLKGGVTGTGALVVTRGDLFLYGAVSAGTVTDSATTELLGATLTATTVSIASGGTLSGYGTVTAAVTDGGEIEATGGTLEIVGAITGSGSLYVAGSATLELAGATTAGAVTDNGTLELNGITLTATSVGGTGGIIGHGTVAAPVTVSGAIEATSGTLDITGAESGAAALEATAGAVLLLAANTPLTTATGTISLTGAGSELEFGTGTPTKIEASLTTIASGGTLAVLGSRGYTTSLGITDSGLLQLGGGTFSAASLSVMTGGKLLGFGTVTPAVANAGTIEAIGGPLDLSAGTTGTGALIADAGATLELANATAVTAGAVTVNGTLDLVGGSLTASSAIVVGSTGELLGYGTVATNIHNSGTIQVNGGQLTLSAGVLGTGALLDTRGVINLSGVNSASTLTVDASVNLNDVTLTATSVTIANTGSVYGNGTITAAVTNNGTVTAGGGAPLKFVDTVSGTGAYTNGASTLEFAGTTTAGAITDTGTLDLAGSMVTATSVTVASTGRLLGSGMLAAPVANSGIILANGGTLDITGAESGAGALEATAGSVVQLAGNAPLTTDSIFISLTGAGSEIEFGSGPPTTIENSLTTISSTGTLEVLGSRGYSSTQAITDSGLLQLAGGTFAAASLSVTSGAKLLAYGTVSAAIANSGTVQVNGGQLSLTGGVTGTGALLDTVGALNLSGANSAGTVTINASTNVTAVTLSATSVTIANTGTIYGNGTITASVSNAGTLYAGGGSTLKIAGAVSGTGTFLTGGSTIELAGNTSAGIVTDNGTLRLDGITLTAPSVTVGSGAHLIGSGSVAAAVVNGGTIESNTGLLDVTGAVTGAGTLRIDAGQTLEVGSAVASTQTAVFASNTGTLSLDHPLSFASSITNFTGSDAVYLGGQTATGFGSYNTSTHVLTVLGAGNATIAQLTFNGSYTLGNFQIADNGLTIIDPPVTMGTTGVSPSPTFINAAAGNDVIAMPAAGTGLDAIGGFSLTNGDVLDFTAALQGTAWHGDLTQVGSFIAAVANGSETDLYLDPTGHGHGSMVAALEGVNTSLASLLAHTALKLN
jgi:fibronectin-binding autotransporter adhesin